MLTCNFKMYSILNVCVALKMYAIWYNVSFCCFYCFAVVALLFSRMKNVWQILWLGWSVVRLNWQTCCTMFRKSTPYLVCTTKDLSMLLKTNLLNVFKINSTMLTTWCSFFPKCNGTVYEAPQAAEQLKNPYSASLKLHRWEWYSTKIYFTAYTFLAINCGWYFVHHVDNYCEAKYRVLALMAGLKYMFNTAQVFQLIHYAIPNFVAHHSMITHALSRILEMSLWIKIHMSSMNRIHRS